MEVKITSENFKEYRNGDLPLVVDLWAPWCGPCRMVGPVISELANDYDGKIVVGKCDVDENDEVAIEFGVRSIPTSSLVLHQKQHLMKSSKHCYKKLFIQ